MLVLPSELPEVLRTPEHSTYEVVTQEHMQTPELEQSEPGNVHTESRTPRIKIESTNENTTENRNNDMNNVNSGQDDNSI